MTQFKSARELEPMLAEKPLTKRDQLWQKEAEFIGELAAHEGLFAEYPKTFKTYGYAKAFSREVENRYRHSFQYGVCNLPGGFRTNITEDADRFHVWIAYTGGGQADA